MARTGSESSESYDVSGYVNIPLVEDKFALRLVGFSATDGGFVDNVLGVSPQQGGVDNADMVKEDINEVESMGGEFPPSGSSTTAGRRPHRLSIRISRPRAAIPMTRRSATCRQSSSLMIRATMNGLNSRC